MLRRLRNTTTLLHVVIHILVWATLAHLPLLAFNNDDVQMTFAQYLKSLLFPVFYIIVFYVNYFYLVPKFLLSKKVFLFFLANILLYAACAFGTESTREFTRPLFIKFKGPPNRVMADPDGTMVPPPGEPIVETEEFAGRRGRVIRVVEPPPGIVTGIVIRSFIVFALTTGVAVSINATAQWFRSEARRKDLEREHLKSELANLKNQLNPHFLFNTLNNIYSLISQNQQRAGDAVLQLGKLMRYLLYESNEKFVMLTKEVEFIHHYIDLMKLRLTSNVTVRYSFADNISGYSIAPLLFISLIENSFKHGISSQYPSEIDMDLKIVEFNKLAFTIRNTSFPKSDNDYSGSGIGLENLRKRLNLLYPAKHTLTIKTENNFYQTVLTVEL